MAPKPNQHNSFLTELSAPDLELLRPHLKSFNLNAGDRLQYLGAAIEQVVFPHGGVVAMTMPLRNGAGGGAILFGREGILGGLETAAAAPAMCDAEVYISGRAARMSSSAFHYVLEQSPAIRRVAARCNTAMMVQAHQTAVCNAAHAVEGRIARWLLEVQDRCGASRVPLTQNTWAEMLSVQRTTVNLAAGRLESAGFIRCGRGVIHIIRRDELERRSCECYRQLRQHVAQLFELDAVIPLAPDRDAAAHQSRLARAGCNPVA